MKRRLLSEKRTELLFFIPLFILCLFLAYQINFSGRPDRVEINSDKADYYVYLPATFIYGWDINKFPPGIMDKTHAFVLDYKTNKLIDKTTCGVAILWAPFFLITHFIAVQWNLQPDGFSEIYQHMTVLPEVFYLILALLFLRRFLRFYVSRRLSYITIILLFAGTNLYFYSIDDGMMSHLNSFFLFSVYLYLLKKFLINEKKSYGYFCIISFVVAFAILIRPTNILILSWMLFLDVRSFKDLSSRIRLFLNLMYILTFLLILFVVFLPQLFYWRYLSGHFVYYSYPGENFANWKNPRVLSAWFAPLNGAFLYIPLLLFFVAGFIIMIRNKITNGIFIGLFFLLISYIFPSWHSWYFGGSFGYRSFVEYYALFALPFAYSLGFLGNLKNLYVRSILIFLILASSYYTMRLTYYQRWNTSSTWAWDDYLRYLDEVGIYNYPGNSYTFITDFDNADNTDLFRTRKCFHSPTQGGIVTKNIEYNVIFKRSLHILLKKPVQRVRASIWVNPGNKIKTGILLTILIENWEHKCYFFKAIKVDDFLKIPDKWAEVTGSIEIPEWIDQSNNFVFQVWNPARSDNVYIDDVKLRFE